MKTYRVNTTKSEFVVTADDFVKAMCKAMTERGILIEELVRIEFVEKPDELEQLRKERDELQRGVDGMHSSVRSMEWEMRGLREQRDQLEAKCTEMRKRVKRKP